MKKLLAAAVCAAMVMSLAACGSAKEEAASAASEAASAVSEAEEAVEEAASAAEEAASEAASAVSEVEEAAEEATSGEGGKVYKVAIDQAFAPFSILQDDGSYIGIDLDVIQAIADAEGFEVEIMPMDFSAIIPSLTSGTIDAGMGCMTITDERKESVDFSDPYYEDGQALVTREDDTIATLEDLKDRKLAIKQGTMGAMWGEDHADEYGFELVTLEDSASIAMAVANGQADAMIDDYPVVSYKIKIGEMEGMKVAVETIDEVGDIGISVKKGENQDLLQMINDGLAKIKEDGTYEEILAKYE